MDDEYIDTSDAEEREAIAAGLSAWWTHPQEPPNARPPRKRRKITPDGEHAPGEACHEPFLLLPGRGELSGLNGELRRMSVTPSPRRPETTRGYLVTPQRPSPPQRHDTTSRSPFQIPLPVAAPFQEFSIPNERDNQERRSPELGQLGNSSSPPYSSPQIATPNSHSLDLMTDRPSTPPESRGDTDLTSSQDPLLLLSQASTNAEKGDYRAIGRGMELHVDDPFYDHPAQPQNPVMQADGNPLPPEEEDNLELSFSQWFARGNALHSPDNQPPHPVASPSVDVISLSPPPTSPPHFERPRSLSPLTPSPSTSPHRSPYRRALSHPPQPSTPRIQGAARTQGARTLSDDPPLELLSEAEAEAEAASGRRYSLRARQARQLNPYEHDRLLYKRQMRAAPEAIVKVVSPSRHSRSRHDGNEDRETQQEYVPPPSPSSRPRRRRSSDPEEGNPEEEAEQWYPKVFDALNNEDPLLVRLARQRAREKHNSTSNSASKHVQQPKRFPIQPNPPIVKPKPKPRPRFGAQDARGGRLPDDDSSQHSDARRSTSPFPAGWGDMDDINMDLTMESDVPPAPVSPDPEPAPTPQRQRLASRPPVASMRRIRSRSRSQSDSEVQVEEDVSSNNSEDELTAKERKRLKQLRKMMPAFMIAKMAKQNAEKERDRERRRAQERSATTSPSSPIRLDEDGDDSEEDLLPGQSKARVRLRAPGTQVIEIEGDSEPSNSSEDSGAIVVSSDDDDSSDEGERGDERKVHRTTREYDHQLGDGDIDAHLDEDVGTTAARRRRRRADSDDRPRGGSLIDRMLQRTNVRAAKPKSRSRKKAKAQGRHSNLGGGGSHRLRSSIRVITAGARRVGPGRQTTLSFPKTGAPASQRPSQAEAVDLTMDDVSGDSDGTLFQDQDVADDLALKNGENNVHYLTEHAVAQHKRANKKKRPKYKDPLWVFPGEADRVIVSGRQHRPVVIEDYDGFRQALAPLKPRSGAKGRSEGPVSRAVLAPKIARPARRIHRKGVQSTHATGQSDHDDDVPEATADDLQKSTEWDRTEVVRPDFGIARLPLATHFSAATYIGKGWLYELVVVLRGSAPVSSPTPYKGLELEFSPTMPLRAFVDEITKMADKLLTYASSVIPKTAEAEHKEWRSLVRVASQTVSWLPRHLQEDDIGVFEVEIPSIVDRLLGRFEDLLSWPDVQGSLGTRKLLLLWFCVEVSARAVHYLRLKGREIQTVVLGKSVLLLVRTLYQGGLERPLRAMCQEDRDRDPEGYYAAELWICLLHVVAACHRDDLAIISKCESTSLWVVVHTVVAEEQVDAERVVEASEWVWHTLFGLSALSHFSAHGVCGEEQRLTASWPIALEALKRIRLTADPEVDQKLSNRILSTRDQYVRTIVSRCFILAKTWKWRLDDALGLITALVEIFKSRRFANLRNESADFPYFLRETDYSLLSDFGKHDTAFSVFLKLVVQAARDVALIHGPEDPKTVSRVKRLLSFILPVGSVPFSKSAPPTTLELSMLYNRLSAVSVAIYLEPTASNAQRRIKQAALFVKFGDSDLSTRQACIRGVMLYAMLFRRLGLPQDDVFDWLAQITRTLVDEYVQLCKPGGVQQLVVLNKVILGVQLVIGAVRKILVASSKHADSNAQREYPNPALLEGPWITDVFRTPNLMKKSSTALEIHGLLQAFLEARASIMPKPRRPPLSLLPDSESQESQDEYGQMDLDMNDPELLAALGAAEGALPPDENTTKDKRVAEIIDQHISSKIYGLVYKSVTGSPQDGTLEEYCFDTDAWIDCWAGCVNVLVRNNRREWSEFLNLGKESWQKISSAPLRRRVGLRFMYNMLRLDPMAYLTYQDSFLQVWIESMVAGRLTMEHDYCGLILSVDGLRHPMLRDLPCGRVTEDVDFKFDKAEFAAFRLPAFEVLFRNMTMSLEREREGEWALHSLNQQWIGLLEIMFSALNDTHKDLPPGSPARDAYAHFCRQVFGKLNHCPRLKEQARLAKHIEEAAKI